MEVNFSLSSGNHASNWEPPRRQQLLSLFLEHHSPSSAFFCGCFILVSANVTWFLLFTATMFPQINTITDGVTTELITPRGNAGLGSYKPLVTTFLPTNQHITLFYVYFCFKVPYWIYIVDSFILNSQQIVLQYMPEGSLFNTGIFSLRTITAFLSLGALGSTPDYSWGPFKTVKSPTKST